MMSFYGDKQKTGQLLCEIRSSRDQYISDPNGLSLFSGVAPSRIEGRRIVGIKGIDFTHLATSGLENILQGVQVAGLNSFFQPLTFEEFQ